MKLIVVLREDVTADLKGQMQWKMSLEPLSNTKFINETRPELFEKRSLRESLPLPGPAFEKGENDA